MGVGLGGVRVDVNKELKFLGKFTKKIVGGRGESRGEVRWGDRVGGGRGVRVDVNVILGVGGDVGYGGCEPRIESIVQCTKRYCTILRRKKLRGMSGGGVGQVGVGLVGVRVDVNEKLKFLGKFKKKWGGGLGRVWGGGGRVAFGGGGGQGGCE